MKTLSRRGPLCFFSKHLPRMNGRELGRSLKALGFDGVDLKIGFTLLPRDLYTVTRVATLRRV